MRLSSDCDLCGKKVGLFQSHHPACITQYSNTRTLLREQVSKDVAAGSSYADIESHARQIVVNSRLSFNLFREAILDGANEAVVTLARESPVAVEELSRLVQILQGFGIDAYTAELTQRRWFGMAFVSMSHTLWQVLHDVKPFYDSAGRMPFNLQTPSDEAIRAAHDSGMSDKQFKAKREKAILEGKKRTAQKRAWKLKYPAQATHYCSAMTKAGQPCVATADLVDGLCSSHRPRK